MGILKIIEMIDRPALGGGPTAVLHLAAGLDRAAFDPRIATAGDGPLVDEARRAGVAHVAIGRDGRLGLGSVAGIARLLETGKIDILHTHGGFAGLYGRLAARRAGTPVVVHTIHGIHYLHYRNPALRRLSIWQERFLSRRADALVLVCQADLALARRHRLAPEGKLVCIPNGLPEAARPPLDAPAADPSRAALRRDLGWDPGWRIVGTVARLNRQKGIADLVRAAIRILTAAPDVRIAVVGDGPLRPSLERQAARAGLTGHVLFLGGREDAARLMSLFDVFVLPSLWEGLPFVLIEAAALGKPIVATAVDGVPEIVDDGRTGLLVPPRDPAALAAAIMRVLEDGALAASLGDAARGLIPPRFPVRRTIADHQDLYLRLYREKTGPSPSP